MTGNARIALLLALGTMSGVVALGFAPALAQGISNHDSSAPVDFEADRGELQGRADRASFSGNVRVRQGALTLSAARMTVAYSGGTSALEIERIDVSGGVVVQSGDETARGNVAIYDLNRRLITMVGGVSLRQGGNTLNGGRLVIDLNSGRSVMDGSATRGSGTPGVEGNSGGRVTGRFTVPERKTGN